MAYKARAQTLAHTDANTLVRAVCVCDLSMAQRVGVCKSGGEGKTFRTLETHVELEGETKKEKSPTCCVELNQRLQILQNK